MADTSSPNRLPPQRASQGFIGWLQSNLFSSFWNGVFSLLALALVGWASFNLLYWIIFSAHWERVWANLRLLSVWRYPSELLWRPMTVTGMIMAFFALSAGASGRGDGAGHIIKDAFLWMAGLIGLITVVALFWMPEMRFMWLLVFAATVLSYNLGRKFPSVNKIMPWLWGLSWFAAIFLLVGFAELHERDAVDYRLSTVFSSQLCQEYSTMAEAEGSEAASSKFWGNFFTGDAAAMDARRLERFCAQNWFGKLGTMLQDTFADGWHVIMTGIYKIAPSLWDGPLKHVAPDLWGGILLTFFLSVTGIVVCFPLGIALALGRQSNMPIIKFFCTLYIEVIRGAPLITWLFIASLFLPLALGGATPEAIIRAQVAVILFAAAYMAENVRGGLQAVPKGQGEASRALGMSGWDTLRLIVLPQALRAVIPAIVGLFIGLFKDTSLVTVVSLFDLFAAAQNVSTQPESKMITGGIVRELFIFMAVFYWFFCYRMSVASRQLEKQLGVGTR